MGRISKKKMLVISRRARAGEWFSEALQAADEYVDVDFTTSFVDAGLRFNSFDPVHVVFISSEYSESEISNFIESATMTFCGSRSAYVLLVAKEAYESSLIAKYMAIGLHGFLCDPCSLDELREVIEVAEEMAQQTSEARLKAVTGIMLTDVVQSHLSMTLPAVPPLDQQSTVQYLQRCKEKYKQVTGESVTTAVVTMLKHLPPTQRGSGYERLRKRVQQLFRLKAEERAHS